MIDDVNAFMALVTVPQTPRGLELAISDACRQLQTELPEDYDYFLRHFGSVAVDGLEIISARESGRDGITGVAKIKMISDTIRAVAVSGDGLSPLAMHPDRPGFLPFGSTAMEHVGWWTEGEPDEWKLLGFSWDEGDWWRINMDFGQFILAVYERRLDRFELDDEHSIE